MLNKKHINEGEESPFVEGEFMDKEQFYNEVVDILNKKIDSWKDPKEYYYDYVEEYAENFVDNSMEDMRKYVHGDTRISGNFANIKYDYEREHDGQSFIEVIKMIDNGIVNDVTNEFRTWSIDWFWTAFGTFGLTYNFENFLDEMEDDEEDD